MTNWNEYIQNKYLDGYIDPDNYNSNNILKKLKENDSNEVKENNYLYLNDIKLRSGIIDSKNIRISYTENQDKISIEIKKNNLFIDKIINDLKFHYKSNILLSSYKNNSFIQKFRMKNININRITYLIKYNNGIYDEYIKFNPIFENLNSRNDVSAILYNNNFEILYTPILFKPKEEEINKNNNINNANTEDTWYDHNNINEDEKEDEKLKDLMYGKFILILKVNTIIVNFNKNLLKYPYIKKIFEKINSNNKNKQREFLEKIKREEKVIIDTKFSKYKKNRINIKNSNEKIMDLILN